MSPRVAFSALTGAADTGVGVAAGAAVFDRGAHAASRRVAASAPPIRTDLTESRDMVTANLPWSECHSERQRRPPRVEGTSGYRGWRALDRAARRRRASVLRDRPCAARRPLAAECPR